MIFTECNVFNNLSDYCSMNSGVLKLAVGSRAPPSSPTVLELMLNPHTDYFSTTSGVLEIHLEAEHHRLVHKNLWSDHTLMTQ